MGAAVGSICWLGAAAPAKTRSVDGETCAQPVAREPTASKAAATNELVVRSIIENRPNNGRAIGPKGHWRKIRVGDLVPDVPNVVVWQHADVANMQHVGPANRRLTPVA